jgi:hypothetical protein
MTEATTNSTTPSSTESTKTSFVDTLFDVGFGWAAHGLTIGKLALQQSAKTLEKTAKSLETLAAEFEKKESAKKG